MLPSNSSSAKFICVCSKHNFGRPHNVSRSTWYEHIQQAETTAEKDRIRSAQALNIPDIDSAILNLPPLSGQPAQGSSSGQCPSDCRAVMIRALAKIAQENAVSKCTGCHKCAWISEPDDMLKDLSMDQFSGEFDSHVPPDDFPMLNRLPIPPNEPPIPPNEPPVPPNEPPVPPNEPPIPPNEPPVPPNEPPVPLNKPPIPPNEPPTPLNEPPIPPNIPAEVNGHQLQYQFILQCHPRPNIDMEALAGIAKLPKIKETMEYILALKNASLEDLIAKLGDDALERLCNPPKGPVTIDSPGIQHSISMYLALEHASQAAYNRIMRSTTLNFAGADGVDDLLSFYKVERLVAEYTGVESIKHDMCLNLCLAFTGPFADLKTCPMCDTS
ncbi:uncharacterized protein BJ212DRAFT_1476454 [Suillus subaureus]|uniref:Uncharacterized protein n=1 Tax=Suillus subaureus TaxID=48587 RepID=A0A9P7JHK0_9AGAM|nr:uncharacterized protein BJ212DRAFT_1476454 [Suillus subaureus]KAG1823586.1 hypothetical protein BJ212DRAFT_1476454 [Suillus subaureus]